MTESKQNSNVIPIIMMYFMFFMIAFVTNLAGSMGVVVKAQFGVSNALAQLGTFVNFIAYACMGIPAGIIAKRKGYKFTGLAAILVGILGVGVQLISGFAASFAVYVVGAFIAGFSMRMLNTVVNPLLNTIGGGGNRGNQLIQFGGVCNSVGGTLAPYLVGWIVGGTVANAQVIQVVPVMIIAMLIFALAFVVLLFTKIPEPHMETAEEKAARLAGNVQKNAHSPLSFRHFVLGAIAIFFYVGVEVGIPNTANLYMSNMPTVGPAVAGTFVAAYWLFMLFGRLIGASVGGKVSSKAMLTTVGTIALLFVLCIICLPESLTVPFRGAQVPVKMIFMVCCGLCTSVMWGNIFNLAAEGLGKYTAPASGIFMTLVCGGGILTVVQNAVADGAGYMASYIVPAIGLLYILFFALLGSKNVNKDIPTE
ncbi:MAG: MFS transporter [Bacteroidales bacterium]|nr:MFS transporter [Bacteroidales bacterium]